MADSGFDERWVALEKTREQQVADSLEYLECLQSLNFICALGSGTYGDVVKVRNPTTGKTKAAKIITSANFCPNEIYWWPKLHHRNIVPAENIISAIADVQIILMPLYFNSWLGCLQSTLFREHPMAIACTRRWIFDLLKALDYLHSNQLCHLDLKLDNVLIDFEGSAVLCDFSCLNKVGSNLQFGQAALPDKLRPPEAFHERILNGPAFDVWACGALMVQAFTGCALNQMEKAERFEEDLFPVWKKAFDQNYFLARVSLVYPSAWVTEQWVHAARQFMWKFIQFEPLMRVTPSEAIHDPFLAGAEDFTPEILHIFGKEAGEGDSFSSAPAKQPNSDRKRMQSNMDKAFAPQADESSGNNGSLSEDGPEHATEADVPDANEQRQEVLMGSGALSGGARKKKSIRHWFQKKWRKVTNFFRSSRA